ncbi:ecdysone-induced protein 78C-like [Uloborus diversus]|uniref:ecdysone-induced protein 78C-like n=1 Tax=Uloborus diversus TaxID=327109 RepID=UPI002409F984|nr:ecdysone-induced protein 78C-like [Uloborus diversus]
MESNTIKKVTDAYLLHCPYSEGRRKAIARKPRIFTLSDCKSSSLMENYPDLDKIIIWSEFAAQLAPLIKPLILFSYSLKDFVRLNVLDKIICLKCAFFEIWLVHVSQLVNSADGAITFCNGYCMSRKQLANIYDTEFVDRLLNFCGCINDLQLSDTVIALYSLVILHNPDQQGLHSPIAVAHVHAKFLRLLKYQLTNYNFALDIHQWSKVPPKMRENFHSLQVELLDEALADHVFLNVETRWLTL